MKRRVFLKGTLASSAVAVAAGAGLLTPSQVLAAWPKAAFEAENVNDAMKELLGSDMNKPSSDINIKAPEIAENGAVVPVTISTGMKNVESISIVVEENGTPLAARFMFADNAHGFVSTRIKMGRTSNVIALVKSGGTVYSARQEIKVTIGGCGG